MTRFVAIILILVLGVGAGIFLANKASSFSIFDLFGSKKEVHITSTVKAIFPTSEYASLVYSYSDVIIDSENNGNFFTGKKAIYTIDGTIKLGFDGKGVSTDYSDKDIIIHMPEIKILSHEIYPETFKMYDEKTGWFNRYTLTDANSLQMIQKTEREKKVNENPALFAQARESAEQQFRTLLENLPGIKDSYNILFAWEI